MPPSPFDVDLAEPDLSLFEAALRRKLQVGYGFLVLLRPEELSPLGLRTVRVLDLRLRDEFGAKCRCREDRETGGCTR